MDKARLIERLNYAISLELCALLQYHHNAQVLTGADRRLWREVFKDMSEGGLEDARKFSERVVGLGGIPTVQPEPAKLAMDATEMLTNALYLERRLVDAYTAALQECQDSPAYRNLIEDQILHETKDCEELEVYLNQVASAQGAAARRATRTA